MKSPKHPESVNYETLEAVTLYKTFTPPFVFVMYPGTKKIDEIQHDTYDIHTNVGTLKKNQIVFSFQYTDTEALRDKITINREIRDKKLYTRYHIKNRPIVLTDEMLEKASSQQIRVTMRSGHILNGILIQHNDYNFTLNINGKVVLLYRHAVLNFREQDGE